jgi:nicotinate dehydrogenase subunit A
MKTSVHLHVNGQSHTVNIDPDTPLLYALRNNLGLTGPKYGCGLQQCGACMVLLDGKAQPSCMLPVSSAQEHKITTLEGISTQEDKLHPVQQAFIDEQAAQCGYCLNGMVISAISLLNQYPSPDDATIREHMFRSLCRCGSQARVMRAIKRAAQSSKK